MTKLYLKCTTHKPELVSGPVGSLLDVERIRQDVLNAEKIARAVNELSLPINEHDERWAALRFVSLHPHCDLEIWDGERRYFPQTDPEKDHVFQPLDGANSPCHFPIGDDWCGKSVEEHKRVAFGHKNTPIGIIKAVLFTKEGLTVEFDSLTPEGRDLLNLNVFDTKED